MVDANKNLHRYSSSKALFLFNPINSVRRAAIRILSHRLWTIFILSIILANCLYNLTVGSIGDIPWECVFIELWRIPRKPILYSPFFPLPMEQVDFSGHLHCRARGEGVGARSDSGQFHLLARSLELLRFGSDNYRVSSKN